MTEQRLRGFVTELLLLAAMLGASAFARTAHATDVIVCNTGPERFALSIATRRGDGLFTPYSWYLEGWFPVDPDDCSTFGDHTDQPIYVAVGTVDGDGHFGGADIESDHDDGSDWQDDHTPLCLAPNAFHYTWQSEHIAGRCDPGFGHFPAALYLEPDGYTSSYTMELAVDPDYPPIEPGDIKGTRAAQESQPYSGGRSFGDELKDAFFQGLAKSYRESVNRQANQSRGDSNASPAAEPPFSAAPPPEPAALGPPTPLEPGTLSAKLFGADVVRRVDGDGRWFAANGAPVDDAYQLRGAEKSDLLDPPEQHPAEADLTAATQTLEARVAGFAGNRGAQVVANGRLFYAYASDAGVRHDGADLVTLDLRFAKVEDRDGYAALLIDCRTSDLCVLAWGEDADGKPAGPAAFEAFRMYAASHADAEGMLGALRELQALYPAEPAVTRR